MNRQIANRLRVSAVLAITVCGWMLNQTDADQTAPKRVLLLGQGPDSHPRTTHEYMAGMRIVARLLQDQQRLQVVVVQAGSPWKDGPELIDGADAVVLYLSEGAKWIGSDAERLAAFERLASRGGGLSCLHWGMGTKEAAPIADFISLFGACHGGPDRRYKVADFQISLAAQKHPVLEGIGPFEVHDEFYYGLKFPPSRDGHTPLLQLRMDSIDYPVAWAWERPDSGRSFGFSGLHFHENWTRTEYRRLVLQGVLWTLKEAIPQNGLPVDLAAEDLALPGPRRSAQ